MIDVDDASSADYDSNEIIYMTTTMDSMTVIMMATTTVGCKDRNSHIVSRSWGVDTGSHF
jgi:hypothetical protein